MTNMPHDESKELSLDEIGDELGIAREPGESDEAYAERLIDVIDNEVERLWAVEDDICMHLHRSNPDATQ
jgi:hypothetical protein